MPTLLKYEYLELSAKRIENSCLSWFDSTRGRQELKQSPLGGCFRFTPLFSVFDDVQVCLLLIDLL